MLTKYLSLIRWRFYTTPCSLRFLRKYTSWSLELSQKQNFTDVTACGNHSITVTGTSLHAKPANLKTYRNKLYDAWWSDTVFVQKDSATKTKSLLSSNLLCFVKNLIGVQPLISLYMDEIVEGADVVQYWRESQAVSLHAPQLLGSQSSKATSMITVHRFSCGCLASGWEQRWVYMYRCTEWIGLPGRRLCYMRLYEVGGDDYTVEHI